MSRYFRAFLAPSCLNPAILAGGSLLLLAAPPAIAQVASSAEIIQIAQAQASHNLLFVNPVTGSDSSDGSNQTPFKTINRAMAMAVPNTIVVLAPGTYSAATGELFPIFMKSDVTIQGESKDRGQYVIIQGSGFYLSRSFAKQKVAIVAANRAGLRGVTVTNAEPQGYGLWIESASPVISDNTFTGNNHDGVSVVGSSAPILRNNYFLQNGANGITIYGNSKPELIENIFENTGFGVNIAQSSAPRLIGNRITQNKDGVVIQGSAQPILRNNVIDSNSRDGLVAIAQARPDLGNTTEAGGNNFFGNGQNDINAKASSQSIPAVGNQLATTTGTIDFNAVAVIDKPVPRFASLIPVTVSNPVNPASNPPARSLPVVRPAARPAVAVPVASSPVPTLEPVTTPPVNPAELPLFNLADAPRRVKPRVMPAPRLASPAELNVARPTASSARGLPKIPELRVSRPMDQVNAGGTAAPVNNLPVANTSNQPIAIPINVPLPESVITSPQSFQPTIGNAPLSAKGDVLPVPSERIPMGNVGDSPSVPVWREGSQAGVPRPAVASLRFRVVLNPIDPTQIAQLKTLVPGAFTTVVKGRSLLQAGAFGDRGKAEELLRLLQSQSLPVSLEEY
jgi:parallel beta-helix repeat protein